MEHSAEGDDADGSADVDPGWFDDPLLTTPTLPLPALVRVCRHLARLSQREFAARLGISKSYLGEIETGHAAAPSYALVLQILESAGLRLVAIDAFALPVCARSYDDVVDRAGRRYPAHLEVERVLADRDWWFSRTRPGQRMRPEFTASWDRNVGRVRRRRSSARVQADAEAELAAAIARRRDRRNTPPTPSLSEEQGHGG